MAADSTPSFDLLIQPARCLTALLFLIHALAVGAADGPAAPALPAPLPSNFHDMKGMGIFMMPNAVTAAMAGELGKPYTLSTRGNMPFYSLKCPGLAGMGVKAWRGHITYEKTFSGRIVYDGVGYSCAPMGSGRVEFEDGSVYEGVVSTFTTSMFNAVGNFEPAVPSGAGRFTFPNGTVVEGNWQRGELDGGPITLTRPGGQPEALATGTLASLRASGIDAAVTIAGTATAAAAAAVSPDGSATPFTPAAGLPFTPASDAAIAAVPAGAPGKAGPQPMLGSAGKYMCPYTEDGVVAPWVDKAIKARMGGAVGGMVGAEAGKKVFEHVPLFGGMFGKAAGDKMGREVAISLSGGWEFIKANSDQSFDDVNDYATWLRMNYQGTEHYAEVVAAIKEIYPELKAMQF